MQITTRGVDDVLVVDLQGSLNSQTCGPASTELTRIAQGGSKKVLLNLERLEFLTSAGLRAILLAAKLLQTEGGTLRICRPNSVVGEVMRISGFTSLLRVYETEKEALGAFGGGSR